MSSDSRASMVRSAASLIAAQGVSATSFTDVLADSGAPRGSIYHHFPLGKTQLAAEAVRWTSERVLAYQRAGAATTAAEVLDRFIGMWRQVILTSGGTSGCVVAGVALDTDEDTELLKVIRETFASWIALLAEQLGAVGLAPDRAQSVAVTTLAAMEGALILCRAEGSVDPLEAVAIELVGLCG